MLKDEIKKFKQIPKHENGAKLEKIEVSSEENLLPTGALHKNKHDDFGLGNDITQKGIPVLHLEGENATEVETIEELQETDNKIVADAEIEKEEFIANSELTSFIEQKRKEWNESGKRDNDICLEVGKRLVKELLFNTKDENNLIESQA